MVASWMVDGEALVVMAVMISSNSPSRQGARTETSDPDFRFRDCGGGAEFFLIVPTIFGVFRVYGVFGPKEESGGHTGWPHPPGAAQGGGAPGPGVGPPWAFYTFP